MEPLKRKRGAVKAKLTSLRKALDAQESAIADHADADSRLELIKLKLDIVEKSLTDFNDVQDQIEFLTDELETKVEKRKIFHKNYASTVAEAKGILSAGSATRTSVSATETDLSGPTNSVESNALGIKLPTIELPKFDGRIDGWLEFRDKFDSLINGNTTINNVQKFHYLRAALYGEAAGMIEQLEFSHSNYEIAWNSLITRYNDKNRLVHNHIKAIFGAKAVNKESAAKIRQLSDLITKHLRALKALGEPIEHWDSLIIYIANSKLDDKTAREWEIQKGGESPTLSKFQHFLRNRANILEQIDLNRVEKSVSKSIPVESRRKVNSLVSKSDITKCPICSQSHFIYQCEEFKRLSIHDRMNRVKQSKLCINCLRAGHFANACRGSTCKKCKLTHNTLLHIDKDEPNDVATVTHSRCHSSISNVLLSTVAAHVKNENGREISTRALLDFGSQTCFITQDLCNRLNLKTHNANVMISGINDSRSDVSKICEVELYSKTNRFHVVLQCLVVNYISHINANLCNINTKLLNIPCNLKLADDQFLEAGPVNVLIGASHFYDLMLVGQHKLGPNLPILQNTRFGWVVSGVLSSAQSLTHARCHHVTCNKKENVDELLKRFWEIEEMVSNDELSSEEMACEQHFVKTVSRDETGRFVVSMPLKRDSRELGDSMQTAEKQFISLEKRLKRNEMLRRFYHEFMQEYINLGHMSIVSKADRDDTYSYYMPHHGIIKQADSINGTKFRTVFNASCATSSGLSLNDIQMAGPIIQDDLLSILLRFRFHSYVISADIEKMYRQVLIEPEQRPLQRIIWRFDENAPLDIYELNTVTYGTKSGSFLAIRCLHALADSCHNQNPDISRIIKGDFYVDDLLTGSDSLEGAQRICHEISDTLRSACLNLRKWKSNDPRVIQPFANDDGNSDTMIFSNKDDIVKILGLYWESTNDALSYDLNMNKDCKSVTKRIILSHVARIFDPLGLLGPITMLLKQLIQQLWLAKLDWDEKVPLNVYTRWIKFRDECHMISQLRINRRVLCKGTVRRVELHGFSDASEMGYGGCIYVRSSDEHSNTHVSLLCAKGKVAPVKRQTIPRMELCGALLLSRMIDKIRSSLSLHVDQITLWSDSTIVLAWINSEPQSLKPFIANRISKIQLLTQRTTWRYVPTSQNPADVLSRGALPSDLIEDVKWWNGPSFLCEDADCWPESTRTVALSVESKLECSPKTKPVRDVRLSFPFDKYSKYSTLVRVAAYCRRFVHNSSSAKDDRRVGPISAQELNESLKTLIFIAQSQSFHSIDVYKKYSNLALFRDNEGLIRVGGRLMNAALAFDKKHPMLLHSKHPLSVLILKNEHYGSLHGGPQLMLSRSREKFWIISGRTLSRKIVRNCVACFRANPKPSIPLMGHLPKSRFDVNFPFNHTGIDYAGPLMIRDRKGRGAKISKAYVCVFVCFATKAVHVELVTDLTSQSFIMCLKRFIARRGKPARLISDNGKNFVGAYSNLKEIIKVLRNDDSEIQDFLSSQSIQWQFNPPYAPHFGGIWEAGVKSVKYHLKRVAGNTPLTFEELCTLLCQVELILNSRPLTSLSTDPNDFLPLTPSHFLLGRSSLTVAEEDVSGVPANRLKRYELIHQMRQHFWERWRKEYLHELQVRSKWHKGSKEDLMVDDVVLIKDDNLPPLMWRLGRVQDLHPGSDGKIRVVTLRTQKGTEKRVVARVCPLPRMDDDHLEPVQDVDPK